MPAGNLFYSFSLGCSSARVRECLELFLWVGTGIVQALQWKIFLLAFSSEGKSSKTSASHHLLVIFHPKQVNTELLEQTSFITP